MESKLSDLYHRCHVSFRLLVTALKSPKRDIGSQMPLRDAENEFDKFRLWAGNVGAIHSGDEYNISLDYRLRESPFYRDRIISFMNTLNENLTKAAAIVSNQVNPMEETEHSNSDSEANEEDREQSDDSDSPWDVSSEEGSAEISEMITELSRQRLDSISISTHPTIALLRKGGSKELPRILEMIRFLITCLYKMPIRRPVALERLRNRLAGTTASHYQHFDVLFVCDLFPEMDAIAATRLGRLISLRRNLLIYREKHDSHLQTGAPALYEESEQAPSQKGHKSVTVLNNIPEIKEPVHEQAQSQVPSQQISLPSKATTHRPKDDEDLQTHLYPPSIAPSETSRASSYAVDQLKVAIPPMPKSQDGRTLTHFLCPYCSITQTISSERSWQKHIFLDLQPYVCTWSGCALQDHFFANRNEWYQHEIQEHRLVWHCNVEAHSQYPKQEDFMNHMYQKHKSTFSNDQLETLKSMFQRPSRSPEGICNLCFRHSQNLRSHISRHLQRIALFALPISNDEANRNSAEAQESGHESRNPEHHASVSDKVSTSSSASALSAASFEETGNFGLNLEDSSFNLDETSEQPQIPDSEDPRWDLLTPKFALAREPHPAALQGFSDRPSIIRGAEEQQNKRKDENTVQLVHTLEGHMEVVSSVAFSPQGDRIASASHDHTVRLWDANTGQSLHTLEGHTYGINSVTFSPQGDRLASASNDRTVRLWNANTGQLLHTLKGHIHWINSVTFSPQGDRIASASHDYTVRLWDANTGQLLHTLNGHAYWVNSVTFSPQGDRLASASSDRTVRLWDANTGQLLHTLKDHTDWVDSVTFSPQGDRIASASYNYSIRLWDANTGQLLHTLNGHADWVDSVTFSPQGDRIASASQDYTVRLWDANTGQPLHMLVGHMSRVTSVTFSPQGDILASASNDHMVRLWNANTGQLLQTLEGHTGAVNSVAFSPQGDRLASTSMDYTVRLWNVRTNEPIQMLKVQLLQTLEGHLGGVTSVAFSPLGDLLASTSTDLTVRLWDTYTGQQLENLEDLALQTSGGQMHVIFSVAFAPQGGRLTLAGTDGTVRMRDLQTNQLLKTFDGCTSAVTSVDFSPQVSLLASAEGDWSVRLWDTNTGQLLRTLEGHTDDISSVAFSPWGDRLASASGDQTVRLWDVNTGQLLLTIEGHADWATIVALSPQGDRLASTSQGYMVRLWDTSTGELLQRLKGHTDSITSVAFSPQGDRLASASNDYTVRLWDINTGKLLQTLKGHTNWVNSVVFSPRGDRLASASQDRTIRLWGTNLGLPLDSLRSHKNQW